MAFCRNLILLALILHSCTRPIEELNDDYMFHFVEEINLVLDDSTSNEFIYSQYFSNGKEEFLVALNPITNSVDKYSLADGNLAKRIKFLTEGPEGINSVMQGFTYASPDSIFIYLKGSVRGSIMINENGEFVKRLSPVLDESEHYGLVNHVSTVGNSTKLFGDRLHFMQFPLFDIHNPSNINGKFPLSLEYSLSMDQIHYDSTITYPEVYWDKIWPVYDLVFSRDFISDSIYLISWPILDSLIVVDKSNRQTKKIPAKSSFFSAKQKPFNTPPNQAEQNELVLGQFRYRQIIFDPYRKLYYRMVTHPLEDPKNKTFIPYIDEQQFSIIVFDKDFNFKKEVLFPSKSYSPFNFFVSEKGIILMKNNYFDEDINEDQLVLHVFNLEP
ncbi:hypothetical protein A33Q_0212 [Indibacter alkaliphilus LW1]|uniref:DUF4221 domain-containing protein n=1 Tax=Indibacter alkaliphilus (strain CCUG 57479 / KCTC 22604 / LW1) TaxID=1189612 RepID=S2ECH3_INDAL|nr:DUF4221 family protein [Indibacter alkaliphilus]EPA00044.1 hypothetical protein A33Q_0212 [Indibacter alkaliphilus LW1]